MTNSISNPRNTLTIQKRSQTNTLAGLIGLLNHSTKKMEKRHTQLQQIINEHFDVYIIMQAEEHILKQKKIISIAYELLNRMNISIEHSKNHQSVSDELIQQYLDEMDILNFMNFEVSKKYFSFIHENYQPRIIQMRPMAA